MALGDSISDYDRLIKKEKKKKEQQGGYSLIRGK